METKPPKPLPDGILGVAPAMAVAASIFLGHAVVTLVRGMVIYRRPVDQVVEGSGCLLLAGLVWGLLLRKTWAWGASLALCGLLSLLVLALGVQLVVTLATEGWGRPHGSRPPDKDASASCSRWRSSCSGCP